VDNGRLPEYDASMNLSVLQREFLDATISLVCIQREMLARFHQLLGISAYDFWIRRLKPERVHDDLVDEEWTYNFHGLELDIQNRHDGRFARLEFGPRGMDDVFSSSSVGIFAVSSRLPWPIFPRLKFFLLENGKYHHARRTGDLFQALMDAGLIEPSDTHLLSLRNQYTRLNELSQNVVDIPDELAPAEMLDAFLCDNFVLSSLTS
jgi:hypothetical protein